MKTTLATLTTALLLSSFSSAFAASTVELTVKGLITPSACTPTLSSGGVIDHGKISAKDIDQDRGKSFKSMLTLNVNCDAQTLFALRGIDNRAASSTISTGYGLGLINNLQKIGAFQLQLLNPVAETPGIEPLESFDDGVTWSDSADAAWQKQTLAGFGDRSSGAWYPAAIKDLTTELHVYTDIAPARGLDLSNEVLIDGSATLEVKYL